MPQITLTSGTSFVGPGDSSLLDAASRAGVHLPYSCKTGRCSTCKCKVVGGRTRELFPEVGLTEQEKTQGWVLSCVRSAETDVIIEADDLGGVVLPDVRTWPCRISHLEHLASDVVLVKLRLPPTADFCFIPGQYIDVIGPGGVRRSYSLANSNFANKLLELHIRSLEGGTMSDYWFNRAKVNDLLRLNGPLGTFFLRDSTNLNLYFLATGTGMAPVIAILESLSSLLPEQRPQSVNIFWGGRTSDDLYLDIKTLFPKFQFIPVLSRPEAGNISGTKGYVQEVLLSTSPDLTNAAVYACGSDAMIHSAREILIKAGLPSQRFFSDAFVCSATN